MRHTAPSWFFDENIPERVRSIGFELFLSKLNENRVCVDRVTFLGGCLVASALGVFILFDGFGSVREAANSAAIIAVLGLLLFFLEKKKDTAKLKYSVELEQSLRNAGYRYLSGIDGGDRIEKIEA